jgi:3-oxoacyl-[acyl-carrier-protein] synthase II
VTKSDTVAKRVVVTGYGSLTSMGENSEQAWNSILDKKIGYKKYSLEDQSIKAKFFARVEDDKERYRGFSKMLLRMSPTFAKYLLVSARQSLKMAFGDVEEINRHYDPFDCGVIMGTGWGGNDQAFDLRDEYRDTGYCNSATALITMPSIGTAVCTMAWNLRGYQNTVIAACATGTIAIGDAYEVIRSGRTKMMIAGGSESLRSLTNIWSVDILQALSKEQEEPHKACCPFSNDRSGFVLAEGAAVVCLEERDAALARGAKILGEITGYGNYSDAQDITAPAADMGARRASIMRAMEQARLAPTDIDYINAHGTSTQLNDLNESNSLKAALGKAAYDIPVSSTKSYSGHLIAAAGSFETILCLKTIETGIIPATINLHNPDPACDLNYVPNQHLRNQTVNTVLNLSFGFGGANAALIIQKA